MPVSLACSGVALSKREIILVPADLVFAMHFLVLSKRASIMLCGRCAFRGAQVG